MNSHVNATMAQALSPFAPRSTGLGCYMVRCIRGGYVEAQFEVFAESSSRAVEQHMHLVAENGPHAGAKLDALAWAEYEMRLRDEKAVREEAHERYLRGERL